MTWTDDLITNAAIAMHVAFSIGTPESAEYWADRYDRLYAERELWEDEYERTMARVNRIGGNVFFYRDGIFFGRMHEALNAEDYALWAERNWVDYAEMEDC